MEKTPIPMSFLNWVNSVCKCGGNNVDLLYFPALHKQVEPAAHHHHHHRAPGSLHSTGHPGEVPGTRAGADNDPLAKSLVRINQELSKVITNLGTNRSASTTPVPGSNTPGKSS